MRNHVRKFKQYFTGIFKHPLSLKEEEEGTAFLSTK